MQQLAAFIRAKQARAARIPDAQLDRIQEGLRADLGILDAF